MISSPLLTYNQCVFHDISELVKRFKKHYFKEGDNP